MSFQIAVEVLRTILVGVLLYFVTLNKAKVGSTSTSKSWLLIQIGISFILFGSILDITDNFTFFNRFLVLGKTKCSTLFFSLVGYLPGITLTAIGFYKWMPNVRNAEKKRDELEIDNVKVNELKQQLHTILRSIGDAVIAVDSEKKIIHINPEAQRITAWNHEDALGEHLSHVYKTENAKSDDDNNIIDSLLSDYAMDDEHLNTILTDKNGNSHLISSKVTPMMEDNELSGMVIIFREMENLETIQKRLTEKKKMESLSIFANGVAHDFNNQLTGVQGFCELLESEVKDEEQLEYISEIRKAVDRSVELTDRLLAFARKEEPRSDRINIVEELKRLAESYGDVKNKIKVIGPEDDLCIFGNKSRIIAVFKDLIDNSLDAINDNGSIEINLYKELLDEEFLKYYPYAIPMGEYARCVIKDNGIGMNGETLEKVYEPFFTTAKRSYGKGMGLASVYGTVSRHDGMININSEFGKGTEVNIYLPLCSELENETPVVPDQSKMNFLVVDDEEFIRFYVRKELERRGFHARAFEDAESALKYFERHPDEFNFAIIDCVMPKISGVDLMKTLLELNKDLKVILMSGKILDKKLQMQIDNCSNCQFLAKPFDGKKLMSIIEV